MNSLGNGLAGAEKRRAKQEIACEQKASDASHSFECTSFIAALRSAQTSEALKNCTDTTGSLRSAIMIELEVYAQGLRDLNKILDLDLQLEPVAGLHYKIDTNHDLVYFEFDRPTLSMREIRAIFLKLGLEPLFVGAIPPELRPRTKTEPLTA